MHMTPWTHMFGTRRDSLFQYMNVPVDKTSRRFAITVSRTLYSTVGLYYNVLDCVSNGGVLSHYIQPFIRNFEDILNVYS